MLAGAVMSPIWMIERRVIGPPCHRTAVAIAANPTSSAPMTATSATNQLSGSRTSSPSSSTCSIATSTTLSAKNAERFMINLRGCCRSRITRNASSPRSRPTMKCAGDAKKRPTTRTISANVNV